MIDSENMNKGEVLIDRIRKVGQQDNPLIEVQLLQVIESGARTNSDGGLLELAHKDDPNFGSQAPRRAWITFTPTQARKYFPQVSEEINTALKGDFKEDLEVHIENPRIEGIPMQIEVRESHSSNNDWDYKNLDRAAKQDGQGNYLLSGGKLIFSNTVAVLKREAEHTFITHDDTTFDPYDAVNATRGNIVGDAEEEPVAQTTEEHVPSA